MKSSEPDGQEKHKYQPVTHSRPEKYTKQPLSLNYATSCEAKHDFHTNNCRCSACGAWAEGSEVEQSVVKDHHQGSIDSSISGNWGPIVLWRDQAGCFAVSWATSRQNKTRSPSQEAAGKPTVLDLLGIYIVFLDVTHSSVSNCRDPGWTDSYIWMTDENYNSEISSSSPKQRLLLELTKETSWPWNGWSGDNFKI